MRQWGTFFSHGDNILSDLVHSRSNVATTKELKAQKKAGEERKSKVDILST